MSQIAHFGVVLAALFAFLSTAHTVVPVVTVLPHTVALTSADARATLQGHCREPLSGPISGATWTWTSRSSAVVTATSARSSVRLYPVSNGSVYVVGECEGDKDSALVTVSGIGGGGGSIAAQMADSLVESISVQTHIERQGGVYGQWTTGANVKAKLCNLGIRHVREIMVDEQDAQDKFGQLYTCGQENHGAPIHLTGGCWPSDTAYTNASRCITLAAAYGDSVIDAFDGWNEVDNRVASWTTPYRKWQIAMWNALSDHATWGDDPIVSSSVAASGDYNTLFNAEGNLSAYMDYGNMHSYPMQGSGGLPSNVSTSWIVTTNKVAAPKPLFATETGYHNCVPCTSNGVSYLAQAKYIPRIIVEYWNRGVVRTNIYELMDEANNQTSREDNWGLVRYDGTVKQSYTAIQNLITLLKDPGAVFVPGGYDYSYTGKLSTTHELLLKKRNGRFYLLLWQEISVWNTSTKQDVTNADDALTLTLNVAASAINVYRPRTGTTAIQTGSGTSINLNVPDEVIVVEIIP